MVSPKVGLELKNNMFLNLMNPSDFPYPRYKKRRNQYCIVVCTVPFLIWLLIWLIEYLITYRYTYTFYVFGGIVWSDLNKNGLYEVGEPLIDEVFVKLRRCESGTMVDATATGKYVYDATAAGMELIPEGEYSLSHISLEKEEKYFIGTCGIIYFHWHQFSYRLSSSWHSAENNKEFFLPLEEDSPGRYNTACHEGGLSYGWTIPNRDSSRPGRLFSGPLSRPGSDVVTPEGRKGKTECFTLDADNNVITLNAGIVRTDIESPAK